MSATGTEKSLLTSADDENDSLKTDYPPPEDFDNASGQTIWPDGLDFTYQSSGEWHVPFGSGEYSIGSEGAEEIFYPIYAPQEETEGGIDEEPEEEVITPEKSKLKADKAKPRKPSGSQEMKSKSLFVHSFPSQFPDVTKTRKSAFGSIFLKASVEVAEDVGLLKSIADNSFVRLNSLLDSFEKIISDANTDAERRQLTTVFKESLQKTLEAHGISKTYSDGSIRWDIYPITQSYLFSVHLQDRLHQTRDLGRIEERILEGPAKELKLPTSWPTKSIWSGYWDSLGMTSSGIYSMPHGVSYFGKMQDGTFHDTNATLTYPNKFKALNCVFDKGKLLSCQFQFPDLLVYEEDWKYCKFPDRRFWSEVQTDLKSAKIAQKTQIHPARNIPSGCYDTGDGFYNPKSLMLESPSGKLLRVPVCEEDMWIKKYCRKGFFEHSGFRPDLFENWFNFDKDLIDSILEQQSDFRAGKITYSELQQFYADLGLLPPFSPFKKRKTLAEIELEEFMKSIPEPKMLKPQGVRKFEGHKISVTAVESSDSENLECCRVYKGSKNLIKVPTGSRDKGGVSQTRVNAKHSKISFKQAESKSYLNETLSGHETPLKRSIPEKFLAYQPVLKLPFQPRRPNVRSPRKKCLPKKSSSSSGEIYLQAETTVGYAHFIERKNLLKDMKNLILDMVTDILKKEREKHRQRLVWAQKVSKKISEESSNKSFKILKELFESIPDKDEYCDSDPKKTCDLKELAKDKHDMLKYWGKRILLLDFNEKPQNGFEDSPKLSKVSKLDLTINADAELLFAPFLRCDD